MTQTDPIAPSQILASFPDEIQGAIAIYSHETGLSPHSVIQLMIALFLELDPLELKDRQPLPGPVMDETSLLAELPAALKTQIQHYATDIEIPPELVIELAIAHFLDPDAMTFEDCQVAIQRHAVERLKQYASQPGATAA